MFIVCATAVLAACAPHRVAHELPPRVIPHAQWHAAPPLGHAADASRRNLRAGDRLEFRDLAVTVVSTHIDSAGSAPVDNVRLRLARGDRVEDRTVAEGSAFNWEGYHVAIVAVYGPGELGAGLTAVEVGTVESMPAHVAASTVAGGADLRLRIPHEITHVTLHHTGSAEPLRPEDDPVLKLRGLQSWGASDRNWWDVPYHLLIDLEGRVYEGRDWRYMGETNTSYDPGGHFLISVIGNYGRQEPTAAQVDAIADLMAWAVGRFDLPLDRIGGHYDYAETSCPGEHLRKYLEDGSLVRMVAARLGRSAPAAGPHAFPAVDPANDTGSHAAPYTPPDVQFVTDMISHHAQAVRMTDMVPPRTTHDEIRLLARRIDVSQQDEMQWMRGWLSARGHAQPDTAQAHAHSAMPGMLREDELQRLEQARGTAFDTLFLEYMIRHHEGALTMVAGLRSAGGARDPDLFQFASHVDADQRSEIERMRRLQTAIIQGGPR